MLLKTGNDAGKPIFQNGELRIDYAAGCVYLKDEEMHLTPIEYKLLCLLSHNVGKVLTHTYITMQIWAAAVKMTSLRCVFLWLRSEKNRTGKNKPSVYSNTYRYRIPDAEGGDHEVHQYQIYVLADCRINAERLFAAKYGKEPFFNKITQ